VAQKEEEVDNDFSIFAVGRTSTTPISVKLFITGDGIGHWCGFINYIRRTAPQEIT